ncbi:MAG: tetratricopeptide repeat protein, partial [Vulcanimicrobiaceae bacterium]
MIDVLAGQEALRQMRVDEAVTAFTRALAGDPENVAAHLGMYEALQVKGDPATAVAHQRRALEQRQLFLEKPTPKGAPSVLLVATPGDWQANVPLEFLYASLNIGIHKLFVGDGLPMPDPRALPGDVIFNVVAQSDAVDRTLAMLQTWLPKIGRPLLNPPAAVQKLSREGVARDFAGISGALVPNVRRLKRESLGRDIELPA